MGGMATVYLAEDVKHRRKVAVKVLRPELAATLGNDRFFREIEIAAQLQHPHILPLLDSGEAGGFLYYVMPFVDGESLRERLAHHGELPIPEAIRILVEVADALAHAHRRGVVHRDMKPDNVMLAERHALITDFGVAKAVSEATGRQQMTTAGVALGTPAYMAPEQAAADPNVDHRADIYAVGAMAYEMLTGRPPFTGMSSQEILAAHVTQAPQPLTSLRPACPPALSAVIMKCLEKRPADRWQTAEALLAQLEPLAMSSGGITPTQTQPTTAVRPDHRYGHPLRVGGLFLLVSAAVLGLVYFLTIQLGLPNWVLGGAGLLLLLGLPIMIGTGIVERRRAVGRTRGMLTATGEQGLERHVTWRRAALGGAAAFGVLTTGTVIYTAMRLLGIGPVGTLVASGKLAPRDKLIVADFASHAADSTLSQSVTEAFRIDIAQSPVVSVLGSSTVGDALARMNRDSRQPLDAAAAREVALREGAKAVVVGEISPIGKGLVLSAKLVAAVDGAELAAVRETANDEGQILPAIDRLSKRVRERIGESLKSIRANEPLEQVTTRSLEALRLYTEGARASDNGESDRAITLLQQAIALDTSFAMAWRKLAVALGNAGGSKAQRVAATTRAYEHRDRLTEIERYQTTAYYFDEVNFDPDKVISAYRAILELKPDDPIAPNNLSYVLSRRRRWAEAEPIARRYIEEQGGTGNIYGQLIQAQLGQGKFKEARASLAEFARHDSASIFLHRVGVGVFASLGQYDSARAELRRFAALSHDPSDQSAVALAGSAIALTQGRLAESEQAMRDFMAAGERRGLPNDYLKGAADLARARAVYRGDQAGAVHLLDQALAHYPLASMPALDRPYPEVAIAYAVAGQATKARALLKEYDALVPVGQRRGEPFGGTATGYVALAEGRPQDAVAAFRLAWDNSGCTNCTLADQGRAYDLARQPDSALAVYQRAADNPRGLQSITGDQWDLAHSYQRLGELYEGKGQKQKALEYYGRFIRLWQDADAELQPQVKEVKQRMAALAGESGAR
jgi:tetratricopeptide (TPR) repeat protein/tRNA A-37 threonylcarbamoyl transferase component Bud32